MAERFVHVGASRQIARQEAYSSDPGRLLGLGRERLEEPGESEADANGTSQLHHVGDGFRTHGRGRLLIVLKA